MSQAVPQRQVFKASKPAYAASAAQSQVSDTLRILQAADVLLKRAVTSITSVFDAKAQACPVIGCPVSVLVT